MARLGRYEIISEIGRGGMGIVYRGVDTALGRAVAIKTISLSAQGTPEEAQQLRDRLMREAQAAATLSHPNVVAVHDVGQEGDTAYVVMELVQGEPLDRALQQPGAPRTPEALLKVLEEIARALDYAHAHGVVHRDVKPANIFVEENGGVKLGDFGVAKVTWSRTMTEAGTIAGSPHYMAPEQLRGERVTGRTDQFALAAVGYTLLTGRKPFDADTFASLASKILFEQAPSPEAFGVRLPAEVEKVLRKGMSKNPDDRFVNCTEFAGALKDAFHLNVSAPRPAPLRPPRPRVSIVPAVVVAAVIVVAAAALFVWLRLQRDTRAEVAYWESIRASQEAPAFEEYLKRYPQGRFVSAAQAQLEAIRKAAGLKKSTGQLDISEGKDKAAKKAGGEGAKDISSKGTETGKAASKDVVAGLMKALGQRTNPKDGLVYVQVPSGTYRMGCSPGDGLCSKDDPPDYFGEMPPHPVTISKPFWMGRTLVTVDAYQRFVKATGAEMPPPPGGAAFWREPKMPMNNVTWEEAGAYCQWAGGRLPTEAEWEYAARAGNPQPRYGKPEDIAWYSGDRGSGNSDYKPHPVGEKAPNALGLLDMLGNMQQWCRDAPHKYSEAAATDPSGPVAGEHHSMRGGGFQASLQTLRASFRYRGSGRSGDHGFRCVLPAQ